MQEVSKNRGISPKMDGENNGKPIKMDDLGGFPYFWKLYKSFTFTTRAELVSDLTWPTKHRECSVLTPGLGSVLFTSKGEKKTPF